MRKILLRLAIASSITLPTITSAIVADDANLNPWGQLVNVAHEYRSDSDAGNIIWANLEHSFDKRIDFDAWYQLVNVAQDYRSGSYNSKAIWTSLEHSFLGKQGGVIDDIEQM